MRSGLVAIVLCTFNGSKYIEALMDSIIVQTYENWELWISDDGSKDNTISVVRQYAKFYPEKIHILPEHAPLGACTNFLKTLTVAQLNEAEYYMFADQDDVWFPDKIEKLVAAMRMEEQSEREKTPLLIHSDCRVTDQNLQTIASSFTEYMGYNQSMKSLPHLLVQNNVVGASVLFNRALRNRIHSVPQSAVMHDHWIALVAAVFGRIVYLPEATYDYRQHAENVIGAREGGMWRELLDKMCSFQRSGGDPKKKNSNKTDGYDALFRQCAEFLEIYGNEMETDDRERAKRFLSIPGSSRFRKIKIVLENGFVYDKMYRTLGELFFI